MIGPALRWLSFALAWACLAGCRRPPSSTPASPAPPSPAAATLPAHQPASTPEEAVTASITSILKLKSTQIPLDVPLGKPPLKADELDVVEIVMEVEDRLGIELTDAALDEAAGSATGTDLPQRLTPRMLIELARRAKKKGAAPRRSK